MFIMLVDKVSVEDLLRGVIVVSGMMLVAVLAEGIAGTEENFADMMNEKALEIVNKYKLTNSSGSNDPDNYSTVRDIAIMSKYLIKIFPSIMNILQKKEFTFGIERVRGSL